MLQVQSLEVADESIVQEFSKFLVFALKQLEQHGHNNLWSHKVLASENLQASDHHEADFRVQN